MKFSCSNLTAVFVDLADDQYTTSTYTATQSAAATTTATAQTARQASLAW
ncbi:hypothetical protein [Tenacibaculum maritimum]|nr:hypothetical protein [Tenacibaculum maritimum]